MKAEINNENKAKFFTQYWDQKIIFDRICIGRDLEYVSESLEFSAGIFNYLQLLLKPLSSISDEDAIEVARIFKWSVGNLEYQVKTFLSQYLDYHNSNISSNENLHLFDYLRSKGYAIPWMGLSVEELVNAGWIKLVKS